MSFHVADVDATKDFDELIECQWEAFENPLVHWLRIVCPIHGTGPSARADSLKESTSRQRDWFNADSKSYWQKSVTDNGKIVGGALWKVIPENPYQGPAQIPVVYWYPEGIQRDFVTAALLRRDAPLRQMATRPHIYLNIMYTHSEYRRRGVADLLMQWGIQKADKLNVEMWLNAQDLSVPLYEKHGFKKILWNDLSPIADNPSRECEELNARLQVGSVWSCGGLLEESMRKV